MDVYPGKFAEKRPTLLYMLRHGDVDEAHRDSYYGQMDIALSEAGVKRSCDLAERLSSIKFDVVYSSDLARAARLAEMIAEPLDLPVRTVAAFRERSMGVLQGIQTTILERDHADLFGQWRADRILFRVPEAENFEDLRDRVIPAVEELVATYPGRRIALVAHAGPIRVALAHAMGLPLEHIFRLEIGLCSVNVLEFPPAGPSRVILMNG